MKYITYRAMTGEARAGFLHGPWIVDVERCTKWAQEQGREIRVLPASLLRLMECDGHRDVVALAASLAEADLVGQDWAIPQDAVQLLAPLPQPRSFRDFYAFEEHVQTARGRRGLEMVPEWYQFPVFYFSNHNAFVGPDAEVEKPRYTDWLDYELEIALVIGKEGRDIPVEDAHDYLFGLAVLNDWSARDVQREEVKVGLGPAKGKDFATSMGPWLVTLDELEDVREERRWKLEMTAHINGVELSRGNAHTIYYTFAELIARASEGVTLYPGDVIGSGTVGTGCLLELGPEVHRWLTFGDVVELEIERLGVLRNRIR